MEVVAAAASLAVVIVVLTRLNTEPEMLGLLKQRYTELREVLGDDPRWKPIKKQSILTGLIGGYSKKNGAIGYNVNKGYEIYICLAGDDVNSAMHVLIHELAHLSVSEYDHTIEYWKNFKDLKALAVGAGLYQEMGKREYCGESIRD
jgi:hypothetical protein